MDRKEWLKEFIQRMDKLAGYRLQDVRADGEPVLWEPGAPESAWVVAADCGGPVWLTFERTWQPTTFDLPDKVEVMICPDCTGVDLVADYWLSGWDVLNPIDFVLVGMEKDGMG